MVLVIRSISESSRHWMLTDILLLQSTLNHEIFFPRKRGQDRGIITKHSGTLFSPFSPSKFFFRH